MIVQEVESALLLLNGGESSTSHLANCDPPRKKGGSTPHYCWGSVLVKSACPMHGKAKQTEM